MSNFHIRPTMGELSSIKPQVSVIVSAYGDMPRRSVGRTLASVVHQTGIRKDVVLSEQYREKRLYESVCCKLGCAYVAEKVVSTVEWNPGVVRNTGALVSRGSYMLFLDADMVLVFDGVLRQIYGIVSPNETRFFAGPRALRISERLDERLRPHWKDSPDFLQELIERSDWGIKRSGYWLDTELGGKVVRTVHNGKEYMAIEEETRAFRRDPARFKGTGATVWHPVRHWGTIFVPRRLFKEIGGYHEGFVDWGCEDTDLLQKVKAAGCELPFSALDGCFAHIEHGHNHVRGSLSLANRRTASRREEQWQRSISTDRATLHNRGVRLAEFGVWEDVQ